MKYCMIGIRCIHSVNNPLTYRRGLRFFKNQRMGVAQDFLVKLVGRPYRGLSIQGWECKHSFPSKTSIIYWSFVDSNPKL